MSSGHHSRRVNLRDDHVKREGDKHRERSPIERNNNGGTKDNDGAAGEDAGNDQMLKNKITSRCRLFVGNLNNDLKESELRELFEKYGDITEFFMSASKGFAFVRLDTRAHAETAKENLDGATVKGRQIRVRYAVHGASLKVSELSSTVSNELLAQSVSIPGQSLSIHLVPATQKFVDCRIVSVVVIKSNRDREPDNMVDGLPPNPLSRFCCPHTKYDLVLRIKSPGAEVASSRTELHPVERTYCPDDRSQPTGDGIIEFERKPAAIDAIRRINEGVFLVTAGNKPVFVEPLEPKDDEDGLAERMIPKSGAYQKERSQPPRFAVPGSFEFEFGNRWKEVYRIERIRREQLERELKDAREKLESEMDFAYQEYQAAQLREDLRRRQEELERLEASRRKSMELYRQREEEKARFKQQQHHQMLPPTAVPASFAVHQRPPPNFLNPPPPLSGQQPIDNRFGNALRNEGMARRSIEGRPAGNSPIMHDQRADDKLVNGVQKLMQLMQQATSNRANDRPPMGTVPSPHEMQQRQLQQQHNLLALSLFNPKAA